MRSLNVFREYQGAFELVGILAAEESHNPRFEYSPSYRQRLHAVPIAPSLPLSEQKFSSKKTRAFFDGLIPEGPMREAFERAARADKNDYLAVLDSVRNEPIGALVFSREHDLMLSGRGYEPLSGDDIQRLAAAPAETSLTYSLKSRISLAGAQSKVGMHFKEVEGMWFFPTGSAPSTHILKACNSAYPNETVNEAICLRMAKLFDLQVPDCFLIRCGSCSPVLVVERYDRMIPCENKEDVCGLPVPRRLHQVDICQAWGILGSDFKYEPTGVSYLYHIARLISELSSKPYEDRMLMMYMQLFHYVVGNADNHLKNWSFVYDATWGSMRLAPIYDVLDTTIYEKLPLEMGVSFGGTRKIDEVHRDMVFEAFEKAGISRKLVDGAIREACSELPGYLQVAASMLAEEGFPEAQVLAKSMEPGMKQRLSRLCA